MPDTPIPPTPPTPSLAPTQTDTVSTDTPSNTISAQPDEVPKAAAVGYERVNFFGPTAPFVSFHLYIAPPPPVNLVVTATAPEQDTLVLIETARPGATPTTSPDSADLTRTGGHAPAEPVSPVSGQRSSLLSAARVEAQAALTSPRVDPPAPVPSRPSALQLRETEVVRPGPDGPILPSATPAPSAAAALPETAEATAPAFLLQAFAPQVSPVLSVLPAVDVAVLEQGMRRFLDQVQHLGDMPAAAKHGAGLGVWIVAGTAAAVACEIARRQLRSRPTATLQLNWLAAGPPDPSSD